MSYPVVLSALQMSNSKEEVWFNHLYSFNSNMYTHIFNRKFVSFIFNILDQQMLSGKRLVVVEGKKWITKCFVSRSNVYK
jgi:hypothetical protein